MPPPAQLPCQRNPRQSQPIPAAGAEGAPQGRQTLLRHEGRAARHGELNRSALLLPLPLRPLLLLPPPPPPLPLLPPLPPPPLLLPPLLLLPPPLLTTVTDFVSERDTHTPVAHVPRRLRLVAGIGVGYGVTEPAPVGGMGIPLRHEVLVHVLVVIRLVRPILVVVARSDRDLASQIRRATSSIGNNVAEGFGTQQGNARVRFETARGSLYEMEAGLQMAAAWGYVADAEIAEALVEIRSLGAHIYGLSKKQ